MLFRSQLTAIGHHSLTETAQLLVGQESSRELESATTLPHLMAALTASEIVWKLLLVSGTLVQVGGCE